MVFVTFGVLFIKWFLNGQVHLWKNYLWRNWHCLVMMLGRRTLPILSGKNLVKILGSYVVWFDVMSCRVMWCGLV